MYLKRIEAHGFKSFADDTIIELNKGITGIVGPNGSGKSNVVDAVRWVLGEQSIKSLRGDGNMTDVIFSGSKSRNASNVASVTLILDNTDQFIASPLSEISLKRRVYKDGTNEYYLNNERCRLKDITDVLIDSGLAKEGFNIISQGKIEEIILSKPSDRRIIFEEAAGVLKYKKRKEEALRKLDKTHDNMNRVNDIVNEISTQLEPLKEQKEKALQFREVKEELDSLELALITDDITTINRKYQDSKTKIDVLTDEIEKIKVSNTSSEAKIELDKSELAKYDENLKELNKKLLELTTKVEKINAQKTVILERQKYSVEDPKLHTNLVNLKERELELSNTINNEKNKITNEKETLEKIILDYNNIENKITKVKKDKDEVQELLTKTTFKESSLKTKIQILTNEIENNSLLPNAVKQVLNNPKLRGIHNVIGNVFEVEEKFATSISTSLGSSASYVIADNEVVVKEAINYLKNNNIGKVTFFPINIIKPHFIDNETLNLLKNEKGFIDVAINLIKYDSKYENILKNQLGGVIICDNIDSANAICKKINYRYKVVTLEGELFSIGGSITGGYKTNKPNIITDKYELEKLQFEYDNIISEIKNYEIRINEVDELLKINEDNLYLKNKEKITISQNVFNLESNLITLDSSLEQVQNEIKGINNLLNNNLSKEEETILNSYYETSQEKDNLVNDINNLTNKRNSLHNSIEEYEFSVKRENSQFNTKNNELKELEIEVNRMDVKLDMLLNTLTETYNITYEKAKEMVKLEIPVKDARTRVNSLKRIVKEIGEVNLGSIEEYDRISTRYEFLTNQREDLIKAEDTLLEIIKEMDTVMIKEFKETFQLVKDNFSTTFKELFKGGTAELKLTDPSNILETGIEIIASPPGKKLTSISLLSGGEKTFTAISLLFAILKSKPTPFCILDEVEAALDEVNVNSFGDYISKLKIDTQFILITHKKKTMEFADVLYGITMQESGVSKLVSVKLEELK